MKLTSKQKRGVKRRVELDQGVKPPHSIVFVSKKIYSRKVLNTPKHIEVDSWTEFQSTFKKDFESKKVDHRYC